MFVRTLEDIQRAGRVLSLLGGTARSARYITAADRIGFSYNDNNVDPGYDATLWYRHHWEANYIVSGTGSVEDLATGEVWALRPGALYVVGPNDRHRIRASEAMRLLSIWNPPLHGDERHDDAGGYPPTGDVPVTDRRMFVKYVDAMRDEGKELHLPSGFRTLRMLTADDALGFAFSVVTTPGTVELDIWYKNHWEANHILSGSGTVTDRSSGETWGLAPGSSYNVGPKDRHRLVMRHSVHVSIFSPPLRGDEVHDADGSYSPSGPVPPGPPNY